MNIITEKKLDGSILIQIPSLNISARATKKMYINQAIIGAVIGMCIDFEKNGDGVENELMKLGLI